ncbi:MAG: carbon monoxide dehydrogenase subunit G [Woeseia sp.]
MDIKGEYRIACGREAVWDALNDPAILQKCLQGCESLERTGDNRFQGKVAAVIGPVRAEFNIELGLRNSLPPESYTLVGESKAGTAGFGRGSADVRLIEQDGATLLTYTAEFKVGGKLAQVGSRLVLGATKKTADDFFSCLARELESGAAPPVAPDVGEVAPRTRWKTPLAVGAAAVGLLVWWFLLR